jgi:hypothetical protein
MSCAPIDRLMQTLRVHIPGATDDMLQLEVFNTIDEFFRRTSAWRYESEIQLDTANTEYDMSLPVDSEFVRMLGVTLNGAPVPPAGAQGAVQSSFGVVTPELTFSDGDAQYKPDASDLTGALFTYAVYRPTYITVSSPPSDDQAQYPLKSIMALSIAKACLTKDCGDWGMPDWSMAMFFQEFLDGVLGRMYQMPAKPWSEATKAVYHHKRFRNGMAFRKQEATKGFVYGSPGWHFPRMSGWT